MLDSELVDQITNYSFKIVILKKKPLANSACKLQLKEVLAGRLNDFWL